MNVQDCKDFMEKENCKCVVADEEKIIFTSNKKGIVPMLDMLKLYEEGRIRPVYQADRILGKAALKQKEGPFEAALRDIDEDDFDQVLDIIRKTLEKIRAQKV